MMMKTPISDAVNAPASDANRGEPLFPGIVSRVRRAAVAARRGSVYIEGEISALWGVSAREVREQVEALGEIDHLDVYINSPGGSIGEGVAIYNGLRRHPANVHVHIEGYALSMGSVIAMAGDTVEMADTALFMIHDPWGGVFGNSREMRHEADVLDQHKAALVAAYNAREQLTLDDEQLATAMADETWYTAAQAREAGFVDAVVEVAESEASAALVKLPRDVIAAAPSWAHELYDRAASAVRTRAVENGQPEEVNDVKPAAAPRPPAADPSAPAAGDAPEQTQVDVEAIQREAVQADRTRAAGIRAAFRERAPAAPAALIERYIDQGLSVEDVGSRINDMIEAGAGVEPAANEATVVADERDKRRQGMTQALLERAGNVDRDPENEFRGLSLYQLAIDSVVAAGGVSRGNRRERVGAAFTHGTSDFPAVLDDVCRRVLLDAYREREETYTRFTRSTSLPDFRPGKRVGMLEFEGELDRRPEGAEYKHKSLAGFSEQISLDTYGNKFSITRELIINDDLQAITGIPQKMGRLTRRTIAGHVFRVFARNPKMSDNVELFAAAHGNVNTTATALTTESVDAAMTRMALNKGRYAENEEMQPLDVRPTILLVPMALRSRAMTVMNAEFEVFANATDSNRNPNSVRNAMEVIADPRLDAISTSDWYLIDGTNEPIERAYLDGEEEPYLDMIQGWDIDGVEYKCRLDLGVAPMEFTSIYKQTGA